jgi:FkbM family methyltransferase
MEIFQRFVQIVYGVDKPVIFEFGTCDGQHTNVMCNILKQLNKDFTYHAFEGDPRIIPNFWKNNSNHTMNIRLNQSAIGNIDGEVIFNLSGGVESRDGHFKQEFYGSSSIKKPMKTSEYWPDMTFQETKVKCCKFDTYYNEVNPGIIDFIWSDIQGAEKELIEGGQEALSKTRYLYTEYNQGDSYEGEISLSEIIDKLPGSWSIVEDYGHDVLLKNNLFV